MSDPALGRPKKAEKIDKKEAYQDNADRIAVERAFALAKHSYDLGLITSKLDTTTRSSIALSNIAMNVDRIARDILWRILILIFSRYRRHEIVPKLIAIHSA